MSDFSVDLKNELSKFNSIEKTFNNFNKLKIQQDKYREKINFINSYVKSVEEKNKQHQKMVDDIRMSPNTIDSYRFKLNNYLKNGDVSDTTKTVITTFLVTLLAFKFTDSFEDIDILKVHGELNKLILESEKVIRLGETDLENERKRIYEIKRKEDDERRRIQRLKDEEDDERRRRSSSSSYSSSNYGSSSYDSGSSFGGGDSGGGGSSGSW